MPQLFAEIFVPLGRGLDLQVGRFYSLIGFESVKAPQNFFYSHSYMYQYGQPRTFTGAKATYDLDPNSLITVGVTRGWDAWQADRDDSWALLWQMTWTNNPGNLVLGWSFVGGREETLLGTMDVRWLNSLILSYRINEQTMYVLQYDHAVQQNGMLGFNGLAKSAKWYGITNYLMRDLTDTVAAGLRVEWFRDQGNSRIASIPTQRLAKHSSYVGISMGLNWRPHRNLMIRPEVRLDASDFRLRPPLDSVSGAYDDATDRSQVLYAVDVILKY